jgi:hypothetical protein
MVVKHPAGIWFYLQVLIKVTVGFTGGGQIGFVI